MIVVPAECVIVPLGSFGFFVQSLEGYLLEGEILECGASSMVASTMNEGALRKVHNQCDLRAARKSRRYPLFGQDF